MLLNSSERGDLEKLKSGIANGVVDPNGIIPRHGVTALHVACAKGRTQIVKYLIEELHCNPNVKSTNHFMTPLHMAAHHGKLDIVKYLLAHGADMNLKGGEDQTKSVLDYALQATHKSEELIAFLKQPRLEEKDPIASSSLDFEDAKSTAEAFASFSDEDIHTFPTDYHDDDDLELYK